MDFFNTTGSREQRLKLTIDLPLLAKAFFRKLDFQGNRMSESRFLHLRRARKCRGSHDMILPFQLPPLLCLY